MSVQFRSIFSSLCALSLLSFVGCSTVDDPTYPKTEFGVAPVSSATKGEAVDFTPVLRFVVCSDIHFEDDPSPERDRFDQMCDFAYAEAAKDSRYGKVDAFCIAGDMANRGTEQQYEAVKAAIEKNSREGTIFLPVLGNHEFIAKENPIPKFTKYFGREQNYVQEVNGYSFILMVPDKGGSGYSEDTIHWLDEQLRRITTEKPEQAVFVFNHHHPIDTVYGSQQAWGVPDLVATFAKYPQVIDFSGHSHFPINDPRSIWQGDFTALGTGTLSYYEMGIAETLTGIFPQGTTGDYTTHSTSKDAAQFYIVEVDVSGDILIKMYDLLSKSYMCKPHYLHKPFDKTNRRYNHEKLAEASLAPVFARNATLSIDEISSRGCQVAIPQAKVVDENDVVWYYTVTVNSNEGKKAWEGMLLSGYYYLPMVSEVSAQVKHLKADTKYTVSVVAHNCWGKTSKPLTKSFRTAKKTQAPQNVEVPAADIFDAVITKDGIVNAVDNVALKQEGTVQLADGEAIFTKEGYFIYDAFEQFYPKIEKSVSFECYLKANSIGDPCTNPLSNLESGGVGLELHPDGSALMYAMVGGRYRTPADYFPLDEFVHLVGTYDGEKLCLYIDGELCASETVPGVITFPKDQTAHHLCLGTDSTGNNLGAKDAQLDGTIRIARIYGTALTAEQVLALSERAAK